jgi:ATP-dependent protease ClpP protease subunit
MEIKGIIGQDYTYKNFLSDYANAKSAGNPIRLAINSVGGYVDEGELMAAFIATHQNDFASVINTGDVASIAASIFLALPFEKRFFDPSKGVALIHNPFIESVEGMDTTANGLEALAGVMKDTESKIAKFIAKQTGADDDVVKALMSINEPLTIDQLESIKFANIIKFKAVALLKTDEMKKEELEELIETKNQGLLDKIMAIFKPKVVALMVTDAEGAQIEFPEVADGVAPVVGDKAKGADGQPASGEIVMATGEIYVFEAGTLTEIKPKEEETDNTAVELEALKAENEALKAELAANQAKAQEVEEIRTRLAEIKSQMVEGKPAEVEVKIKAEASSFADAAKEMKLKIK